MKEFRMNNTEGYTLEKKINTVVKAKAREYAEKEGRGFVEAEWLQNQEIEISERMFDFIKKENEKGYEIDDLDVRAWISTHDEWYTYFCYTVENNISKVRKDGNQITFPKRSEHQKSFLLPLLEKEEKIKTEKEIDTLRKKCAKLEESVKYWKNEFYDLDKKIHAELQKEIDNEEDDND